MQIKPESLMEIQLMVIMAALRKRVEPLLLLLLHLLLLLPHRRPLNLLLLDLCLRSESF